MARADLLIDLVRAGMRADQGLFRKTVEALVAEERSKQHFVLADRLASHLKLNGNAPNQQNFQNGQPSELFFVISPQRQLADLILSDKVALACHEIVEEQQRADILRSHNLEPRNRVMLVGPPGNGKTSLAEAIASALAVPLFVVRYEAVIASFLGETAVRLNRLFDQVRTQHCVLFFDEFDVVGKERGDIHETGEIKRVVSSLLLQVDALPSYVIVVTATNHPELLDRAVWRRFQLRLELPSPTSKQRAEWIRKCEERLGMSLGVSAVELSRKVRATSFSDLEQFLLDIQRRYVLSQPGANVQQIVRQRIAQWENRFSPVVTRDGEADSA